jgi:tetratricopeptide (TPR) repeat protein
MRIGIAVFLLLYAVCGQAAPPQAPSDEDVAARFRDGQEALRAGRIGPAVAAFEEVLRMRPDLMEARLNLGLAHFSGGEYGRAAAEMARVLESQSAHPAANLFLGLSYVKLGLPRKAVPPLRRAIRADGSNRQARSALAACHQALREYRGAAAQFRALFALERDPEAAWFELGRGYLELASQLSELMVWEYRTSSWAHRLAADLFAERSVWDEAEQEYRKTLEIDPAQPGLHAALASVLLRQGKGDEAAKRVARELDRGGRHGEAPPVGEADLAALAIGPGCAARSDKDCAAYLRSKRALLPGERLLLGRALFRLGDYEHASDAFAAALEEKPGDVEALYWLIRAYTRLSDQCFTKLLTAYPDSPRTHQLKAESHRVRGAYDQAVEEYRKAIRERPDDPELYEAVGDLYLLTCSYAEARKALNIAERLDPSNPRIMYLLGRVYLGQEEPGKAVPYLERAVRHAPNLLEARAALGRLYLRAGKPAAAIPELQKAAPLDHYGDLHYLLYRCHIALGQKELAAAALARSRELRNSAFAGDRAKLAEINPVEPAPEQ